MTLTIIEITPGIAGVQTWRDGRLLDVPAHEISAALGVRDAGRSACGKSLHGWYFRANGKPCAIWDYKGVQWSFFGPADVMRALFGAERVRFDA